MSRLLLLLLLAVPLSLRAEALSYSRDIQPIFTRYCVACHACYDAPCQLNLGSSAGVQRGANPQTVYNGRRTTAQQPSRLHFDAQGEAAWRRMGFFPVLPAQAGQAALLGQMLELGREHPLAANQRLPEQLDLGIRRDNLCPLPDQLEEFRQRTPGIGMPFVVTGLAADDYQTLQRWLAQGAPLDQPPLAPSAAEAAQIAAWEQLLNAPGTRQQLLSRWLYEHLFLAHLYFEQGGAPGQFFQLVRSRTPGGEPIDPIATRRPNDDPGTRFFYRLWQIPDVIVHKTHITYPLSPQKLQRVRELFLASDWTVERLPGYGPHTRANPFETFAAIPPQARYQFMLDNAEYFVRTFIRGPVCRGQIATDVIRDHFWTLFQDPRHDLYITDARYRAKADPLLVIPGQLSDLSALVRDWPDYRQRRNQYEALRTAAYADAAPPGWADIWTGNDNALLTIFRHFDSASVRKGLIGAVPQTSWLLDYPLLERTYYQLVVNFDVFGTVSHQAQTRMYFDLIRNGAEHNLLRLLPAESRQAMLESWYAGSSGKLKLWLEYEPLDSHTPSALQLPARDAYRHFSTQLLKRTAGLNATPDPINRCTAEGCFRRGLSPALQAVEQALSRLADRPAARLPVILQLPEATLLRVELPDGSREIYSLLRNRAHSNVAFMLGEALRYQPEKDELTVYPGVLTSYPNFLFNLRAEEVESFVEALEQLQDAAGFRRLTERWGVRRSHPQFWDYFHDLSQYIEETEPVEAGVLDMNRYENL